MSGTTPGLTHGEIEELLGAYALDALEPAETAAIEVHLQKCLRCVIEVGQHHEVAGLLANSGGNAPDVLWEKISDRLFTPTGVPSWDRLAARLESPAIPDILVGPTTDDAGDEQDLSGRPVAAPADVIGSNRPHHRHRRHRLVARTASTVAVAAAMLAVVLGVEANHLYRQVSALKVVHQSVSAAAEVALESPTKRLIALSPPVGSSGQQGSSITLVIGSSGTSFLFGSDLSPLPPNQTYQLWGSINGQLISLGVLGSKPGVIAFTFDAGVKVQAFAITAEQGGGVVRSNHLPVVEGAVSG